MFGKCVGVERVLIGRNGKRKSPTTFHHSNFITFSQTAGLAAFAAVLVDGALVRGRADVVIVS